MAALTQPLDHVHAHLAETDESEFHGDSFRRAGHSPDRVLRFVNVIIILRSNPVP